MLNQSVFYYLKKVVQASDSKTEISYQKTQIRQCLFLEKGGPTLEFLLRMKRCFMSNEAFHISNAHNWSLRVLCSRSPYSSVQALFCPRIDPKRWLPWAWLISTPPPPCSFRVTSSPVFRRQNLSPSYMKKEISQKCLKFQHYRGKKKVQRDTEDEVVLYSPQFSLRLTLDSTFDTNPCYHQMENKTKVF